MATSMEDACNITKRGYSVGISKETLVVLQSHPRRGHYAPHHEEYLKERAEFIENFRALEQEGLAKGFLIEGFEGVEDDDSAGVWVYDESVDDYYERIGR